MQPSPGRLQAESILIFLLLLLLISFLILLLILLFLFFSVVAALPRWVQSVAERGSEHATARSLSNLSQYFP
jgi:hypothetical protein